MSIRKYICVASMFCFGPVVLADELPRYTSVPNNDVIQQKHYTRYHNRPSISQINPLKVVINVNLPSSIITVGQSVNFLLARSGYSFIDYQLASEETNYLMKLPLPEVHRKMGPITLDMALKTIAGEAFELVVDPVYRKLTFELSEKILQKERNRG